MSVFLKDPIHVKILEEFIPELEKKIYSNKANKLSQNS
jgi:hypothetical protein